MFTPRSAASMQGGLRGSSTPKGSATPQRYGVTIPTNPKELLLLMQRQHKQRINHVLKDHDILGE